MIGPNWQYYIIDEQGRSYFVQNGTVQLSSIPTPLLYTPDGWQKTLIGWERNWTYYGVNRNFTNPLAYVKDGAMIMRHLFYNGNIETKAYLLIQKKTVDLSATEFAYVYRYYYKGENDFSTFKQVDISEGYKVTCSIMEGGFSRFLKAYNNTTYEVPCNSSVPEAIKVWMDGRNFYNKMNFLIPEFDSSGLYHRFLIPIAFVNEEGDSFGIYKSNQDFYEVPNNDPDEITFAQTSTLFFLSSATNTTITITGNIVFQNTGVDAFCSIYFKTSLGGTITLFPNALVPSGATISVPVSQSIPLVVGETLFLVFNGAEVSTLEPHILFTQTSFFIETITRLAPTICYALRPKDLFQKMTNNITSNAGYTANSTVLDAKKNLVITCGQAIRGFDTAVIKTDFDDFFKAHSIVHMGGLEYDDEAKTVEIEKITKYFDPSNPIPLGLVRHVKFQVLKDQIFNVLNIGYPDQNYDSVNGLMEFNTTSQYSTPITRIAKTLDMIMPYRADSYGIEILRKDYQNLDTTDSDSDNDTFILNIEDEPDSDGVYHLRRVAYDSITGVLDNTVYNIEDLTPKRLMQTNGALLRSLLYGFDAAKLVFQTTDKNSALSTTKDGVTITEAADQPIYLLADRLFKTITVENEPKAYPGLIDLLNANTNRCFSFEYEYNIYKGFNLKVGIAPNDNETQTFNLLLTADSDVTQLIRSTSTSGNIVTGIGARSGILGVNGQVSANAVSYDNADFRAAIADLGPMMIREPGGTIANSAGWETAIPSVNDCKLLHDDIPDLKWSFVLNMITRDLANQLDWLAALAAANIPITNVEMGNEFPNPYEWMTTFGTKENYFSTCATWIAAIKAIYPNCQFGIPGGNRTNYTSDWNQLAIQYNPSAYLVYHYHNREQYAPGGYVDTTKISNLIDADINTAFAGIPAKRIWVTEINLKVKTGGGVEEDVVFANDEQHGIAAAYMLQKFYELGCPVVLFHNVVLAEGNGTIVANLSGASLTATGLAIKQYISSL